MLCVILPEFALAKNNKLANCNQILFASYLFAHIPQKVAFCQFCVI